MSGLTEEQITALKLLRVDFAENHISKLPKPTKAQTDAVKADYKNGMRCQVCGGWHHKDVVHLDYVGHAALTDRLLSVDPAWSWEPVAMDAGGLPAMDKLGGLWIRLTVAGVTRLGYGHPDGKTGGDAIKEAIGDALRNAAMRFGCALALWHKGDLHTPEPDDNVAPVAAFELASKTEIAQIKQALILVNRTEEAALNHWQIASMDLIPKSRVGELLAQLTPKQKGQNK